MLAMEEILCEVHAEDTNEQGLPPGFRFHPTDEELITFYLASKVFDGSFCGVEIAEIDLNRCEPWELPDVAKMGESEWYFFSLRDRKYPTGLRTNRATEAGYWKATGKDKEVYSASSGALLGMKKTLVFYKGRAPRGEKTKWVMHEYRLDGDFSCRHTSKEEWVMCRIFNKSGGEKKNPLFHANRYFAEAAAAASSHSRPMEYRSQSIQMKSLQVQNPGVTDPLMMSQAQLLGMNSMQSSFSPAINTTFNSNNNNNNENKNKNKNLSHSQSILIKSLLSHSHHHQDLEWELKQEATVPKQCKIEPCFSHFQLPPGASFHCGQGWEWEWELDGKIDHDHQVRGSFSSTSTSCQNQNPSFFEMMGSGGFSGFTDATVHEMSTSVVAFNRIGSPFRGPDPCGLLDH